MVKIKPWPSLGLDLSVISREWRGGIGYADHFDNGLYGDFFEGKTWV